MNVNQKQNNSMTTTGTAIKYGVPMPETCMKLDWQGETLFSWVKNNDDEWVVITDHEIDYYVCEGEDVLLKAPQMHEIAPLLKEINGGLACLKLTQEYDEFLEVIETKEYAYIPIDNGHILIENGHYAEAYAQMYLELKNQGLI